MNRIIFVALLSAALLTACQTEAEPPVSEPAAEAAAVTEKIPADHAELFEYIIEKWRAGEAEQLYVCAAPEITDLMDRENFAYMFESLTALGGALTEVRDVRGTAADGIDVYTARAEFADMEADLTVSLRDGKICGFMRSIRYRHAFERCPVPGITERHFLLESGDFLLNAVYTFPDDGAAHPAVLLISGSGPMDRDGKLGLLTPYADLAQALAERGIASLRFDKRTLAYADDWGETDGIAEEYLEDCAAALAYLRAQPQTGSVYLLGHSLGGQIAAQLAAEDGKSCGMILWNSTARHLADVMADQYAVLDPANAAAYAAYAEAAKACAAGKARGYYFFSVTDHYWASYNVLDTIESIRAAAVPTRIVNSRADSQIFDADLTLWQDSFTVDPLVRVQLFDDLSHYGYPLDLSDPAALYSRVPFPTELADLLAEFIAQP